MTNLRRLTAIGFGAVACVVLPQAALASANDTQSTAAYLRATRAVVKSFQQAIPAGQVGAEGLTAEVTAQCPSVLANAPHTEEFAQVAAEATLASLNAFTLPAYPAVKVFARRVAHLRWSNRRITKLVHAQAAQDRAEAPTPAPHLCSDLKAWVENGYRTVPRSITEYEKPYVTNGEKPHGSEEDIEKLLARHEDQRAKSTSRSLRRIEKTFALTILSDLKVSKSHLAQALGLQPGEV